MTIGILGEIFINLAFLCALISFGGYLYVATTEKNQYESLFNWIYGIKGLAVLVASGLLIYLLATNQFQYYYVYNYTSTDLAFRYLISAFYGGQEGSFMLWILISAAMGFGLIRWTGNVYRPMVMAVMAGTQVFLLSMISGLKFGDFTLGASAFRTLAEAMPDAPFLQANPGFVPADGKGLNDLLKSPWMMIHPPILFVGFSMMTVPYAFAMSALWNRKYNEWIKPAFPWILGANLCLLTAIFLGGYWAYVTLSFGGYWAWDPVENASFVPWLIGVAGIHTMLIQRKHDTSQKASIFLALLSYMGIIYETFLTRSGILGDASVHSFVDLGLYNQLLLFMAVIALGGIALFAYRYKDLPSNEREFSLMDQEWWIFWGAMVTFILGVVIIVGTSSPILGKLFQSNPTPPEVEFYNNWSLPLSTIMALMTVVGQYLWWKKIKDAEALASQLLVPVILTAVATMASIMLGDIRTISYMILLFAGWFAIIGNGFVVGYLIRKNPKNTGGALTHVGFGLLLVGILASSAYNSYLLDAQTENYNMAVARGEVTDDEGIQVMDRVNLIRLERNEPTEVNNEYLLTYKSLEISHENRPGEQFYEILVEDLDGNEVTTLYPVVYPMLSSSTADNINWSVDPDVHTGAFFDLYLYAAGSSYVDAKNNELKNMSMQPAGMRDPLPQEEHDHDHDHDEDADRGLNEMVGFKKGETKEIPGYTITFEDFEEPAEGEAPDNSFVAVKAKLTIVEKSTGEEEVITPLFAIVRNGEDRVRHAHAVSIEAFDISVRFANVVPMSDQIQIQVFYGNPEEQIQQAQSPEPEWVLLIAEKKPFVSVVWLGTFVIMIGFSVTIYRRWLELKQREQSPTRS